MAIPSIEEYSGVNPGTPGLTDDERAVACDAFVLYMISKFVPDTNLVAQAINNLGEINKGDPGLDGASPQYEPNWVLANAYEYLTFTIVDGDLYFAIQDVPENTQILNTNYWVKMSGDHVKDRGSWVGDQEYQRLSLVRSGDRTYLSKQLVPTYTNLTDTDFWLPLNGKDGAEFVDAGAWDITSDYQKLNLVSHPIFGSFVAKQFVPKEDAIGLDNTNYWLHLSGLDGSQTSFYFMEADPTIDVNPPTENKVWFNRVSGAMWVCTDNTPDNNVWVCHAAGAVVRPYVAGQFDFVGNENAVCWYSMEARNTEQLVDEGGLYHAAIAGSYPYAAYAYDATRDGYVMDYRYNSAYTAYFNLPSSLITALGTSWTLMFKFKFTELTNGLFIDLGGKILSLRGNEFSLEGGLTPSIAIGVWETCFIEVTPTSITLRIGQDAVAGVIITSAVSSAKIYARDTQDSAVGFLFDDMRFEKSLLTEQERQNFIDNG